MSKKLTERQRWVRLDSLFITKNTTSEHAAAQFDRAIAIIAALGRLNRIVRVSAENGNLIFKARRS